VSSKSTGAGAAGTVGEEAVASILTPGSPPDIVKRLMDLSRSKAC
jgi:hypothetical protein